LTVIYIPARIPQVGDSVAKTGGDYTFFGKIVSVFQKKSGAVRVVVENQAGILHIFSPRQLLYSVEENNKVTYSRYAE